MRCEFRKESKREERKRFTRVSGISVDPKKKVKKEKRRESEMRESKKKVKKQRDSNTAHAAVVVDYHHNHPLISALKERNKKTKSNSTKRIVRK